MLDQEHRSPCDRRECGRIRSPSTWTSSWLRPPAGSSSSRILGSAARRRRASSTRFLGAERQAGNRDMGDVIKVEIAQDLMDALVDFGLAAADPGELQGIADDVHCWCGHGCRPERVVEHRKDWETVLRFWKVRPMPISAIRCGGPRQDALAIHQDVAGARLVEPAQAIETGVVLPAPFGPIRPRIWP